MSKKSTNCRMEADHRRETDPRVERTRAQLRNAIVSLARERDLDTVRIADVAARAGVNRATVYQHVRGRDELLVDALDERVGEIAALAALSCPADRAASVDGAPAALCQLFAEFEANLDLFRRILGPNGSGMLFHHLLDVVRRHVRDQLPDAEDATGVAHDLRAAFLSGALIGVVTRWLDDSATMPRDEIASAVWRLLTEHLGRSRDPASSTDSDTM